MSDRLSAAVESFIREHIRSVAELELLLMMSGEPARTWTADEAAKSLYVAADAIRGFLDRFCVHGFCELSGDTYRYAPKTSEQAKLVSDVRDAYQNRRLTVISQIYAGPVDKLQSFADAFRFRRPEKQE